MAVDVLPAAEAGTVFDALSGLATRRVSASELGGPIMIAQASVQAARSGLENLLFLIALISTNLAVFNLLPIPPLDGSHVLANFLPRKLAYNYMSLARFGFLILIAMMFLPPLRAILALVYAPVQLVTGMLFSLVSRAG